MSDKFFGPVVEIHCNIVTYIGFRIYYMDDESFGPKYSDKYEVYKAKK